MGYNKIMMDNRAFYDDIVDHRTIADSMKLAESFMIRYRTAMDFVIDKLNFLSREFKLQNDYDLVDSMQHRIKTPDSILEKVDRKHLPKTRDTIFNQLHDIAGVRVITRFISDVYTLEDMLLEQPDIKVVTKKDYIKHPKENGYRSLHLIVTVPIYLTNGTENIAVEIQIRTIAMNFWASVEHELNYKKDIPNKQMIREDLSHTATYVAHLDQKMDHLRDDIWSEKEDQ
ncbi:GTP pyrophosphokinase [Paucilactobacillus vaccinostercus DSM 20634]|jgi:GTP pyrophosphokinase/putative GTP pyrophosphokinase|uniref:GTP pyrophosphokinase n=2 Tax=Paucilactobacillus vaccinostercus TaxID=176291 RepID=A0A0R2A035_9LACO|nr:GTP pyrophosphokinase [Paucilactobacillus vaccinostercus DSM 20634]